MDGTERIAREIQDTRATRDESRETESYISGLKRALVVAFGEDAARRALAMVDESY